MSGAADAENRVGSCDRFETFHRAPCARRWDDSARLAADWWEPVVRPQGSTGLRQLHREVPNSVRRAGKASRKDTLSQDPRFLTLFPNFVLGVYLPDQIGVHLDVPVAPDRTLQRRAIYSLGSGTEPALRAEQLAKLWRAVHREDHAMLVRLQQGHASEVASGGGVLSPPRWMTVGGPVATLARNADGPAAPPAVAAGRSFAGTAPPVGLGRNVRATCATVRTRFGFLPRTKCSRNRD